VHDSLLGFPIGRLIPPLSAINDCLCILL